MKSHVEKETGVASNLQRLIFLGKVLKNTANLSEYSGMLDGGSTIHMVKRANAAPDDQQQQQRQQQRASAAATGRNMFSFQHGIIDTVCVPDAQNILVAWIPVHVEVVELHVFHIHGHDTAWI